MPEEVINEDKTLNNNIFYIIKEVESQRVLPYTPKKIAKTNIELSTDLPPRLFKVKGNAKQALQWWREGRWYIDREGDINVQKDSIRKTLNLEIVKVKLTIVE